MSTTTPTLPYSVSSGSAFGAFDKLQGIKNYANWKTNMHTVLLSLRQWGMVDGTIARPVPADRGNVTPDEAAAIEAWDLRSISAYMEVSFRVAESAKSVLGSSRSPKDAWEALERRFGARQEGIQSSLISKLQMSEWNGSGSILTHRDYMVDLRTQLRDAGRDLSDQAFHGYFTESLPTSLDLFITLYDDSTYDVDLLCDKFAKYEMRQKLRATKAGKAEGTSDGNVALFGQQSADKGKGKRKRDLTDVTCYGCGKKGHLRRNCPTKKDEKPKNEKPKNEKPATQGEASTSKADKADATTAKKPSSGALYTAIANASVHASDGLTSSFYVDSGASDHIVPSKADLRGYRDFEQPLEIAAANGGKIYAYGTGYLRVAASANGIEREVDLDDVYFAPGVHVRLLSLGKLEGQGWDIRLRDGGMELRDREGDVFTIVSRVNNVYPMKLKVKTPGLAAWMDTSEGADPTHQELVERLEKVVMIATAKGGKGTEATLMTWHRRLGHPSFRTVVELARSGTGGIVITDMPAKVPGLDACAACVAGKSVHLPHKEGRERATEYLERVHIDIAGPMPVVSAGGREYVYVIVDDYTRAVYTKPLRLKSEAAEAFKSFKAIAENESGKRIREVLTDNARELSMGEMSRFCETEGIKLNTTVPYHPASNGIAERTIGVLTNAVRAMLHDAGLPKSLWAEAFRTATYVRNRTPTKALDGRTPYEMLYKVTPDLAELRAFGAPCAIVSPSEKLRKLDDRASMCVFVGYKYGGGGYRVWDPRKSIVVETRDITFYEDGLPPPTYRELATQADDADEPVIHAPIPSPADFMPPTVAQAPVLPVPPVTTTVAHPEPLSTEQGHPRVVVRLPGRYMDVADRRSAPMGGGRTADDSDDDGSGDGDSPPERPIHDVSYVPDYPTRSLRSGRLRDGGGGRVERGGRGGAMFSEGQTDSHPIAFSAGLPGGIQLSQLPDPRNAREAMAAPDAEGWRDAMDTEMKNLESHDVYDLVPRAPGMRTLRLGWVLHRKFKNGTFEKNKARLVARGNHQRPGIDYGESFSPVMRLESLRTLLALAASRDFDIIQFDVTSAYLHGNLKEELYMEQPDGYAAPGRENWVWRLKKGLYGLVQAGRTWNEELNTHMESVGYTATDKDPAVYVKGSWNQKDFAAGGFWVDDFVSIGSGKELDALAKSVDEKYGITGLGDVKWVLGMLIERDRAARENYISQEAFINSLLTRFSLTDAVPLSTPLAPGTRLSADDCPTSQEEKDDMATRPYRELVGALAWLALGTRPDIAFATSSLARFGHNPGRTHWETAKRVLRYLKGTRGWRLKLGGSQLQIGGYTDAD